MNKYVTLEVYTKEILDTCEEMLNFIKLVRRNPNTLLLPDSETLQKVDKWIRIVDEKRKGSKLEIVNTDLDRYI